MRKLTVDSVEFRRIMHNLHIEELDISSKRQQRLLEFINSGQQITTGALKEIYQNG